MYRKVDMNINEISELNNNNNDIPREMYWITLAKLLSNDESLLNPPSITEEIESNDDEKIQNDDKKLMDESVDELINNSDEKESYDESKLEDEDESDDELESESESEEDDSDSDSSSEDKVKNNNANEFDYSNVESDGNQFQFLNGLAMPKIKVLDLSKLNFSPRIHAIYCGLSFNNNKGDCLFDGCIRCHSDKLLHVGYSKSDLQLLKNGVLGERKIYEKYIY